jgi:hypothetical protein
MTSKSDDQWARDFSALLAMPSKAKEIRSYKDWEISFAMSKEDSGTVIWNLCAAELQRRQINRQTTTALICAAIGALSSIVGVLVGWYLAKL